METAPEYGIKISIAGVSVQNAADYQLVFNSNWPSIAIVFDATVTVAGGDVFTHVTHGLGFYPFVQAYLIDGSGNSTGRILSAVSGLSVFIGLNTIYIFNGNSAATTVNIKCYNIDLTKPANYTLPQPAVLPYKYDPTYGIKVVKYGKNINSIDLRDFILNSQAQSPAILSIITDSTGIASPAGGGLDQISYTNPVNYAPWLYGFSSNAHTILEALVYQPADFALQTPSGLSITPAVSGTGQTTTLTYDPTVGGATLVVIRDPLLAVNNISVTY